MTKENSELFVYSKPDGTKLFTMNSELWSDVSALPTRKSSQFCMFKPMYGDYFGKGIITRFPKCNHKYNFGQIERNGMEGGLEAYVQFQTN